MKYYQKKQLQIISVQKEKKWEKGEESLFKNNS